LLTLIAAFLIQQLALPPAPRGYGTAAADVVVDAAGVLSPGTVVQLNGLAFDLRAKTGGEIAFVTMPDLRGRDVADVALRIGRDWGVGANAPVGSPLRNAGIVVLVVPKETSSDGRGHVRIEVGRGAEGFIPDAVAGDIQRAAIEYLQRQDYDGAFLTMGRGIAQRFAREFGVSLDSSVAVPAPVAPQPAPPQIVRFPTGVVLFFLVVAFLILSSLGKASTRSRGRRGRGGGGGDGCLTLLWLLSAAQSSGRRGRHHGGWGGGGFGGGSFGGGGGFGGFGGGGGFSGGGSSGSW
jgi:uncharacterized protein